MRAAKFYYNFLKFFQNYEMIYKVLTREFYTIWRSLINRKASNSWTDALSLFNHLQGWIQHHRAQFEGKREYLLFLNNIIVSACSAAVLRKDTEKIAPFESRQQKHLRGWILPRAFVYYYFQANCGDLERSTESLTWIKGEWNIVSNGMDLQQETGCIIFTEPADNRWFLERKIGIVSFRMNTWKQV